MVTIETASCYILHKKLCFSIYVPINSPPHAPKVSLTGVAINHDGRAATITAPNGTAQQRVLRSVLAERQTQGEDVTMIECHGTGERPGSPRWRVWQSTIC